jgi:hypothetical protein
MSKASLHEFYLSLIPNLVTELFFIIPKDDIRDDIIEKLDFLKTTDIFDKIYVMDYYQGPMEYKKGRNNKYLLLKGNDLNENIFRLLEKKSEVKSHEFDYVLEKYFELAECLFYITNWMNTNLTQIVQTDDAVHGIFYMQCQNYKKHFEVLVKHFYPSKDIIPKGNFNALELVDTYFPDIASQYNKPKETPEIIPTALKEEHDKNKPQQKKTEKKPLITEVEAEDMLLKRIFNLDITKLK